MTCIEKVLSAPLGQALLPGLVAAALIALGVAAVRRQRNKHKSYVKQGAVQEIVQACIEKIKVEFGDRIPIVSTSVSRYRGERQGCLEIWFVVATAAIEDSLDSNVRVELEERTREELLYLGYFRNCQDRITTRVASQERIKQFGMISYLRGDIGV